MAVTSAEMFALKQDIKEAQENASEAQNSISTHEQLCALRYEGIAKELKEIKKWGSIGLLAIIALLKWDKLADAIKLIGM